MKTIKNKIKAVIFDLDGTIIKSEHLWQKATRDFLASKGFKTLTAVQEKLLEGFSGTTVSFTAEAVRKEFNLTERPEEISRAKRDLTLGYFKKELKFIEGFERFHKQLRDNNIPSSIATNCDDFSLKHIVDQMKLDSIFSHIYGVSQVNNKAKPSPDIFIHAVTKLGVSPSECIIFEDSVPGFMAAKAAGIKCIAIKNETNKDHLHLADGVINDYNEALEIIKQLLL